MKTRLITSVLLILTACDASSEAGDPGFETSPCIEGECFDGLECLSDLCVAPDGTSSAESGNPSGGGGLTTSNSASGPTSASASSDGSSASASDTASSASDASASDTVGDSTESGQTSDGTTTGGLDDGSTTGETSTTSNGGIACGDGDVDPGEQCDGNQLQGFDCTSLGLGSGTLACDPITCTFDTSMCGSTSSGTTG